MTFLLYLDIAWRTLAGLVSLGLDFLGVPWLLVITVAVFGWIMYRYVRKARGM